MSISRALVEYQEATNYYLKVDLAAKIPDEYMPYLQNYRETGENWQKQIKVYMQKHPKGIAYDFKS